MPKQKGGMGAGGHCVCPKCGYKIEHRRGVPCLEEKCPECGAKMLREDSYHHELLKEKQNKKNKGDD
jgi:NAD-dependent SIR2 family protein deacetylase